jgi:hypothetical protein
LVVLYLSISLTTNYSHNAHSLSTFVGFLNRSKRISYQPSAREHVNVFLNEIEGRDEVILEERS